MTQAKLFHESRECICCAAKVTARQRQAGDPNIVALSIYVTRKGTGKTRVKASRSVRICEACLVRALAPSLFGVTSEGKKLLGAFRDSLSASYSALQSEDDEPKRVFGTAGAGELFA